MIALTKAQKDLMMAKPFAVHVVIPDGLQDKIRHSMEAAAKGEKKALKKAEPPSEDQLRQRRDAGSSGAAKRRAAAQARRMAMLPQIRAYLKQGMNAVQIAPKMGVSSTLIRRTIKQAKHRGQL